MTPQEEAISDCKYIRSLGIERLHQHLKLWQPTYNDQFEYMEDNEEYQLKILEIQTKLNTPECLLEK